MIWYYIVLPKLRSQYSEVVTGGTLCKKVILKILFSIALFSVHIDNNCNG